MLDRVFIYVVTSLILQVLLGGASRVERDVLPAPRVLRGSLRMHRWAIPLGYGSLLLERSIKLRSRWGWLITTPARTPLATC